MKMQDATDEVNLYSILNLTKDASNDQIRKSYFLLARVFHPDKQRNETTQLLEANSQAFIRIEEAYKILINKLPRLIYDHYGYRGLSVYFHYGERFKKYEKILNSEYSKRVYDCTVKVKYVLTRE